MRASRSCGYGLAALLTVLAVLILGALAVQTFYCPCERTPGGWLLGNRATEPVTDWSFANDVPLCQVQVWVGIRPHAINLNCMAADGELFLSCAGCEGKTWSTAALERPEARLRLDGTVYPVTLTRVDDPQTLARAWRARERKLGRPDDTPPQPGWWSFHATYRH